MRLAQGGVVAFVLGTPGNEVAKMIEKDDALRALQASARSHVLP